MTNDIRLAFAHPSERAEATAGDLSRDRISLRDHTVEVEIGAFQAERGQTQRIRFNVVVEVQPANAPLDDDVDRIMSYDAITEAIALELDAERLNLLETLAERVAERILLEPLAMRVFVRIEKLDRGPGSLGVEIVRSRNTASLRPVDARPMLRHPMVVLLSNEAMQSDLLTGWIDQMTAAPSPVILCVGPGVTPAPKSRSAAAQRRIDLLAIEQNAWVLAGLDQRCVVVGTRTELDWAMKNGQTCVWAPSKIVMDSVHGPSAPPRDSAALALWFATEMEAEQMLVIGGEPPVSDAIPVVYRDICTNLDL